MCTIIFSWRKVPGYRLLLLSNRDEFYQRPTQNAHWWEDHPGVLAGRDLQAGGTWMGINKKGRFAAVTNFRKFPLEGPFETSRGDLVKDFLTTEIRAEEYLEELRGKGQGYEGYNLLFGDATSMYYHSNKGSEGKLDADVYGISNHLLNTPWPKVENGKKAFEENILGRNKIDKDALFTILENEERAEDHLLPETGIGLEKERMLSSIFIKSPEYGTRISTILSIDDSGLVNFHERSHLPRGEQEFNFKVQV